VLRLRAARAFPRKTASDGVVKSMLPPNNGALQKGEARMSVTSYQSLAPPGERHNPTASSNFNTLMNLSISHVLKNGDGSGTSQA
jgi:hypothetical protein